MGKEWNPASQLNYFKNRKDLDYINDKIKKLLIAVYTEMCKKGIDKVINKRVLKEMYNKYVNN